METLDDLIKCMDDFELDFEVSDREVAKQFIQSYEGGKILTITAEDGLSFHVEYDVDITVKSFTVPSYQLEETTYVVLYPHFIHSDEEMEEGQYPEVQSMTYLIERLSNINYSREFQCFLED